MTQKNETLESGESLAEIRRNLEKALESVSSVSKALPKETSAPQEQKKELRPRTTEVSPNLRNAALLILISGGGMILLAIVAKMIRDYSLPRYVSGIGSFVLGFVAVLVLQLIVGYFNDSEE